MFLFVSGVESPGNRNYICGGPLGYEPSISGMEARYSGQGL